MNKRILFISGSLGLGHVTRDIAIANEIRSLRNDVEIRWLAAHPRIGKVNYPGLTSHPQHELAQRLFPPGYFGGMISFEIKGAGREQVFRFMEALELVMPATTLGDVYSLVLYPPMSSHRALSAEERERVGISDRLIRLSVGIEEASEIIEDLDRALTRC